MIVFGSGETSQPFFTVNNYEVRVTSPFKKIN